MKIKAKYRYFHILYLHLLRKFVNSFTLKLKLEKAIYWYKKAADNGYIEAQYNLTLLYYKGTERNLEKAIYWYKKVAELKHNIILQYCMKQKRI